MALFTRQYIKNKKICLFVKIFVRSMIIENQINLNLLVSLFGRVENVRVIEAENEKIFQILG